MVRVSVIIPSYNRAHLIGETIESVLRQTLSDFELIVVDDGSTDNTAEVVRAYDGPIRYVFQNNQGRSRARNAGYHLSQGEYVCFLDSDDVLAPPMLERLAALLDSDDKLGFAYSDYQFVDQSGAPLPKPEVFRAHPLQRGNIFRHLLYFDFIPPSTVLARRSSFEEAGLFEPSLEPAEDLDWLLRMSRRYATDYIVEPLCRFRKHEGSTSTTAIHDATVRVILKHLADEATKQSLAGDWRRVYHDLYLMAANEFYNQRDMARARKYYFKALEIRPPEVGNFNVFGLILKSYFGSGTINLVSRVKEALQ